MSGMATWQDGPEYAPLTRPDQFEAPEIEPLDVAVSRSLLQTDPLPEVRPEIQAPQQPAAPLDTLTADRGQDRRDPTEAFQVVASLVTNKGSAWSAAHSSVLESPVDPQWAPPGATGTQPVQLSSQPPAPAGVPSPRPAQFAPIRGPQAVSFGGFLANLTPAVAITLLLGGFISALAPLLFGAAFVLASRVRLARTTILRVFTGGASLIGLVAFISVLTGPTLGGWWSAVGLTSLIVNWLILLASAWLVLQAMQNGEQPMVPGQRRSTW